MEINTDYTGFFEGSFLLVLLLPLVSAALSILITEKYSWLISLIAPLLMLISTVLSLVVFFAVYNKEPYLNAVNWFELSTYTIKLGIYINNISVLMLLLVTLISFLVHLYSIGYMAGDESPRRYFAMLGFFTFSMLGVVVADNLLSLFIFWELVGFSSYMLIGHWQQKHAATAAANKAFIVNRIGDAGFIIGLVIIWANTHTFNLIDLSNSTTSTWQVAASLCLFCGVIGKSAQFPLLIWLPHAMEGPTPVSALIHAATMVAAGVFLLARVDFLFPEVSLNVLAVVGITTAVIAAVAALAQTDIKKLLAYSTISQLGLMVTAVGAGSTEAAMLHLFTHAFFKACLFLCAGSVIHSLHQAQHEGHMNFDVQDINNLGGLRKKLPFTFLAFIFSGSALVGIPFFSGFISKEAIFNALLIWKDEAGWRIIILVLAFIVSFVTVLYTLRLIAGIFLGKEKLTETLSVKEPPGIMRAPIALLSACSIWIIVSWNPFSFAGWLLPEAKLSSPFLTLFSATWIATAALTGYWLWKKNITINSPLLLNAFYLDRLLTNIGIKGTLNLAFVAEKIDRKWIDGFIHGMAYVQVTFAHIVAWFDRAVIDGVVNFFAWIARVTGSFTRSFQGGKIQVYIFWSVFAIIIFIISSLN